MLSKSLSWIFITFSSRSSNSNCNCSKIALFQWNASTLSLSLSLLRSLFLPRLKLVFPLPPFQLSVAFANSIVKECKKAPLCHCKSFWLYRCVMLFSCCFFPRDNSISVILSEMAARFFFSLDKSNNGSFPVERVFLSGRGRAHAFPSGNQIYTSRYHSVMIFEKHLCISAVLGWLWMMVDFRFLYSCCLSRFSRLSFVLCLWVSFLSFYLLFPFVSSFSCFCRFQRSLFFTSFVQLSFEL